ncbi:uncharacterized protein [Nicotiana tomentosiformis]|uniref:uncharacterized protein n=1 Tax=Nicotiana tomentosiformis TaxID=4098 RepID=UPI00388C7B34
MAGGRAHNDGPTGGHFFTENQYRQILDMLNKDITVPQVNMAGITNALMTDKPIKEWIVNSGATHHIAASLDILHSKTELKTGRDQVHLPTGEKTNISHIGSAIFLKDMEIKNILYDLWRGRVRGIGKESGSLYVVKDEHIARSLRQASVAAVQKLEVDGILWHKRLGHTSANVPTKYWGECITTAVYIINRLRSIILQGKSPYELLHHQKPSLEHLRVFGCLCYATTMIHGNKFSARAKPAMHLGYSGTQKGYKLLDLPFNHFFVCRGSVSFEHEPLQGHAADHTLEPLQTPAADHASEGEADTADDYDAVHEAHEDDEVDVVCENAPISHVEEGNVVDAVVSEQTSEPQQATHDEHTENDPAPGQSLDVECIDVVPEYVPSEIRGQERRSSGRSTKEPIWLQDYVTKNKAHNVALYPISDYLCYDQLSQACKSFVANVSAFTEPQKHQETRDGLRQ